jgi:phosphoribosylformylglycinamidine cyclo-ligase
MFQVFNMGCRLEIYTDEKYASEFIDMAGSLNLDAQVIGRVEESNKKSLLIKYRDEEIEYNY